jgi:putative SOS response-associated peptidase YedK
VVIAGDAGLSIYVMKWGFLPFYAKDIKEASKCFNAKLETVSEKPAFKQAFQKRRCLVPVTGIYEWRDEGKPRKTKYRFNIDGEAIFSLAGINVSNPSEIMRTAPGRIQVAEAT